MAQNVGKALVMMLKLKKFFDYKGRFLNKSSLKGWWNPILRRDVAFYRLHLQHRVEGENVSLREKNEAFWWWRVSPGEREIEKKVHEVSCSRARTPRFNLLNFNFALDNNRSQSLIVMINKTFTSLISRISDKSILNPSFFRLPPHVASFLGSPRPTPITHYTHWRNDKWLRYFCLTKKDGGAKYERKILCKYFPIEIIPGKRERKNHSMCAQFFSLNGSNFCLWTGVNVRIPRKLAVHEREMMSTVEKESAAEWKFSIELDLAPIIICAWVWRLGMGKQTLLSSIIIWKVFLSSCSVYAKNAKPLMWWELLAP